MIEKEQNDFSADKNTKSGFRSQCKTCINKKYALNKEKILEIQKTKYDSNKKKEYYIKNADNYKNRSKKYYIENRSEILKNKKLNYDKRIKKLYYDKNKDKINKYSTQRIKDKRQTDSIFRFKHNVSSLIRNSIKRNGFIKSKRTEKILGCTLNEFLCYISNLFLDGMSFDNHGQWHIDHIRPIVSAKTKEEVVKLNHYTNLQPLWAKDNLTKSAKYNQTYESNKD
jgi:hypothetical protein